MARSRRAQEIKEGTLDLLPLMNLFCAMIPFLLTATAFYQLTVINLNLVTNSPSTPTSAVDQSIITLDLFLNVKPEGYVLVATKPLLDDKMKIEVPKLPDGNYDLEGLHGMMVKIKDTYPDANTLFLTVDTGVPYNDIVVTLDYCRERRYRDAEGKQVVTPLFPKVALSKES